MMAYQQYTDRMSIGCCQQWWDYFTNTNRNFLSRNLYESNIGISFGALPSSQAGNQILIWIWNLTNWQKIPDFLQVHNVTPYHPRLMAVKHEFSLSKTVPMHPTHPTQNCVPMLLPTKPSLIPQRFAQETTAVHSALTTTHTTWTPCLQVSKVSIEVVWFRSKNICCTCYMFRNYSKLELCLQITILEYREDHLNSIAESFSCWEWSNSIFEVFQHGFTFINTSQPSNFHCCRPGS